MAEPVDVAAPVVDLNAYRRSRNEYTHSLILEAACDQCESPGKLYVYFNRYKYMESFFCCECAAHDFEQSSEFDEPGTFQNGYAELEELHKLYSATLPEPAKRPKPGEIFY